jgi:HEAT repeat protein
MKAINCILLLSLVFIAVDIFAQDNGQSLEILLNAFNDPDYYVRLNTIEGLVKIGKPAVKPLIEILKNEDPAMRMSAAEILGKIGDVRALRPLVALLEDEDATVRIYVINALGELRSESALKPLLKFVSDEDPEARKSLAEALGKIDNNMALKPLIKLLEDPNIRVRESAARALWEITKQGFGDDSAKWQEWFYKK